MSRNRDDLKIKSSKNTQEFILASDTLIFASRSVSQRYQSTNCFNLINYWFKNWKSLQRLIIYSFTTITNWLMSECNSLKVSFMASFFYCHAHFLSKAFITCYRQMWCVCLFLEWLHAINLKVVSADRKTFSMDWRTYKSIAIKKRVT